MDSSPPTEQTWVNWKIHWTAAFVEMLDINCMTAGYTAFKANQAVELKKAQQMAASLDNLTNASIQKNTTSNALVATNATLAKTIADLQSTMVRMYPTGAEPHSLC